MNQEELKKLPRVKLQKLAKAHGVKANLKTELIITQLLERIVGQPFTAPEEDSSKEHSLPQEGETQALQQDITKISSVLTKEPSRPSATNKRSGSARPRDSVAKHKRFQTGSQEHAHADGDGESRPTSEAPIPIPKGSLSVRKASGPLSRATAGPPVAPQAARQTDKSISSTSRTPYIEAQPLNAVGAAAAPPPLELIASRSSDHTRSYTGDTDTWVPEIPDNAGPFYSISTGVPANAPYPPGELRTVSHFAAAIRRIMKHGPCVPPGTVRSPLTDPEGPRASEGQDDMDTMSSGGSGPWPVFNFDDSQAPTATNTWTPSTPPRSQAPGPAPSGPPLEKLEPEGPRATEEHLKAVVGKMADISKVHKQRWAELNGFEERVVPLMPTVDSLRTLVRQERAQCERMTNYLAYWNPVGPKWKEADIWDRACPTRIDEAGNEIEIVSEDEDLVANEHPLPSGAKPTDIVMRKMAYRRDEDDECATLHPPSCPVAKVPSSDCRKRRRPTPMNELGIEQRPSKRLRDGAEPLPEPLVPVPVLDAISEDQEDAQ
ncbi:hypothetical protein BD414DRAFT_187043 [Trametes punicea]|nr:hypothetical protein BD414DRAFT_187043 [Trametes punicea]